MTPSSEQCGRWLSFLGALCFCLAAFGYVGCASIPASVKFESRSTSRSMGFDGCKVSVALTPEEVIENAKRSGNPNPEQNGEWIRMAADLQAGDQLRLINCLGVKGIGDPYYYALIRNNAVVLKFRPMIFD